MGTHFDPNCKHFCSDSHFIEFPFYREKIATLYNFFRYPFPEKHAFWSRNPCCLTSFFSKSSHFRESVAICWQNPHFIENPFYREKIAAYFGGISRKIPILSNSHFIENVLYIGYLNLRPVLHGGPYQILWIRINSDFLVWLRRRLVFGDGHFRSNNSLTVYIFNYHHTGTS